MGIYTTFLKQHLSKEPTEEEKTGAKGWFESVDADHGGTLSKDEIFAGIFSLMDHDQDGTWSHEEVKDIFRQYAAFMGRKLKQPYAGWEAEVERGLKTVDESHGNQDGLVTLKELSDFFKAKGGDFRDLKGLVKSLSE